MGYPLKRGKGLMFLRRDGVCCTEVSVQSIRLRSRSRSYFTTDSQSDSMSWYRAPLWDLWPDIISCRNVAVWNLRSCICGAPSLTRRLVCNLQCNHSMVRVAQNPKPYFTVSSETPPTWRVRFSYLYPPGTGWPSFLYVISYYSPLTTGRAMVEVF
jgi:ribosomal protein L24E